MLIPKSLKLPSALISTLQKPMGKFFKVLPNDLPPEKRVIEYFGDNPPLVFVVGDFVSNSLLEANYVPDLIIIDDKTQRNQSFNVKLPEKFELLKVRNKPGEINKSSWELIRILCSTIFDTSNENGKLEKILKVIKVDGEEDLLVLPLVYDAPLGSIILYGYPPMLNGDHGIILIEVTQEIKDKVKTILGKFEEIKTKDDSSNPSF
jgi:uncharacterized protein (UPF0218 family)